jgi:hypothetical protein
MRHVSPRLAELTAHAQALTSSGDLAGASAVLADALAPTDTDPLRASPDLAEAAALHARILVTLGDPQGARDWAGFAHTAQRRLYGPDDRRTLAATATHAAVLHRVGNHALAAQLYRDVVEQLSEADGPDSLRVLAAQADLATAEHAAGECADAQARLADAWQRHRRLYGDAAPAGIKMLARLGGMERDCGQLDQAREHLALAGEFCARYLPGDHVLARQVAALARAPISGRHRCDPDEQDVQDFPPDVAEPPGVTPLPRQQPAPGGGSAPTTAYPTAAYPTAADRTAADRTGVAGLTRAPEDQGDACADRRLSVPLGRASRRVRRPLAVAAVAAVGVLAAAGALALTLPRDDPDPAAAPTSGPHTAAGPGTGPATTAAGPAGTGPTAAGPAAGPATAAAVAGRPAPTGVSLRDARDSVTLQWTYPAGAEGPVLISGGRSGQEQRAFQQLPAGSVDYVVYGLNERADYCFTVALVWATDEVAAAPPVCTARP